MTRRPPLIPLSMLVLLSAAGGCRRSEEVPASAPPLPVRLEVVEAAPFQPGFQLLGVVEPQDSVAITARVSGPVEYPSSPGGLLSGMEVSRGQLLARQREVSSEHELEVARLTAESAASELTRHRESWQQGLESDAVFQTYKLQAELANERLQAVAEQRQRLDLRAPVSGRLDVERRYPPGTDVAAGSVLATILTEARRVRGWAGSADRERLSIGQPARVRPAAGDGPPVAGTIAEIAPLADRGGAYSVVVQPADPEHLPPAGDAVEIDVLLDNRPEALTVPDEAVVLTGDGTAVFVAVRSGGELRAQRRSVSLGERSAEAGANRVEILQGLTRGSRVVVEGASLLSDGAPITALDDASADG